jgi:hypothetical protein
MTGSAKQSILPLHGENGLLRGACHPAALCADRVARNDVEFQICVHILAALTASEVASTFAPLEKRGRRESRVPNAPAASRAK